MFIVMSLVLEAELSDFFYPQASSKVKIGYIVKMYENKN